MFLDILFPKTCIGCGGLGFYICDACKKKLVVLEKDICFYCRKQSFFGLTHPGCLPKYGIDGASALYLYNTIMQKIIKSVKYRLSLDVWKEFMTEAIFEAQNKWNKYKSILEHNMTQTIPLFEKKKLQRGFNQADLVVDILDQVFKLNQASILIRKKDTKPQAEQKSKKNRFVNMRGAFKLYLNNQKLPEKIILVDDVITSGSTLKEATKVFKKAGVKFVYGMALARG